MSTTAGQRPKIVVGIDPRSSSNEAFRWAVTEAVRRCSSVTAVHAYELPVWTDLPGAVMPTTARPDPDLAAKAAGAELESALATLEPWLTGMKSRPAIDHLVMAIPPGRALVEAANDADLVVVGSHRPGPLRGLILGSVSHYVVQHATCAAAVIPAGMDGARGRHRIVVGIDGSEGAERALAYAWREAGLWGAALDVVHAWEYPYLGPRFLTAEGRRYMEDDAATVMDQALAKAGATASAERAPAPAHVTPRVVEGPATRVLVESAKHADALVVARRGRGGVASVLLGSVSLNVCHHANCPVVVVH